MADDTSKNESIDLTPENPEEKMKQSWNDLLSSSWEFLKKLSDLRNGLDREGTIVNIKNNKRMQGANAWLLMCSIMIASLGLDLNSPAVIIGAMLISPLMSPILGVGLAIGINDKNTLLISLQHFGIAIAIAIVTSTIYFWMTPIGNETDEIISRTSPGFLDVMVAFFGGIAGIISGSRKDKSNAIPGVAIATALMPPLCVTGYGIANGNWIYMFNSFYLFFLNATFVALATFLIVRFLQFPVRKHMNERESLKTRWFIIAFSLMMILPSAYIFSKVIKQSRQEQAINDFVKEKFPLAIYDMARVDNTDSVRVSLSIDRFLTENQIQAYQDELSAIGVNNTKLNFLQDADSRRQLEELKASKSNKDKLIEQSVVKQKGYEQEIAGLVYQIDSLQSDTMLFRKMSEEVKILFPDLEYISLANKAIHANLNEQINASIPVLYLKWKEVRGNAAKKAQLEDENTLIHFVRQRVELDTLMVTH